eukprot:12163537-Alexandrium_andersonii.AAC.1
MARSNMIAPCAQMCNNSAVLVRRCRKTALPKQQSSQRSMPSAATASTPPSSLAFATRLPS